MLIAGSQWGSGTLTSGSDARGDIPVGALDLTREPTYSYPYI